MLISSSVWELFAVHYVGILPDGTEFVSTRSKGEPVVLKLSTRKIFFFNSISFRVTVFV